MLSKSIEYFKVVAELKSFTKAAKKIHISQPSLSRSIKMLEDELNTQLLVRKSKGVELTEAGSTLYQHTQFMQQEYNYALMEIDSIKKTKRKTFKIGAGLIWIFNHLPQIVNSFSEAFSDYRIEIITGYSKKLHHDLCNGDFDIVFCDLDLDFRVNDLTYKNMIDVEFTLFARKDHQIFHTKNKKLPEDLKKYEFAVFRLAEERVSNMNVDIRRFKIPNPNLIRLETTSIITLFETLTNSDLIASLPLQVAVHADRYDIKEIDTSFRCSSFHSGAIYREHSSRIEMIELLIRLLQEQQKNKSSR